MAEQNVRDVIKPRQLKHDIDAYWKSLAGSGSKKDMFTLAYQWKDKPHRHVYDLIAHILYLEKEVKKEKAEMKIQKKIQKLATLPEGRPETGPMSFGDDWPGVFIRGDNAIAYSFAVNHAIHRMKASGTMDDITLAQLRGLAEDLESCRVK
jgi:plasmid stabilization system protein ParE